MQNVKEFIIRMYEVNTWISSKVAPVVNIIARFFLTKVFFLSGLTKISDWRATLFLFKNEYHVPVLSPDIAALLATFVELVVAPLFLVGFLTRYCALCLLGMAIVINYSYISMPENYYWMVIFSLIAVYGGDYFSVDHWIQQRLEKSLTVSDSKISKPIKKKSK